MKACLILLVGTLALVNADPDPCDWLAADNEYNKDHEENSDQQLITLNTFFSVPRTTFLVNKAANYKHNTNEHKFCTTVSHDVEKCGAITYDRWIEDDKKVKTDNGFKNIEMQSQSYSVNTSTNSLIKYIILFLGVNIDDYIIQKKKTNEMEAVEYYMDKDGNVKQKKVTVDGDVKTLSEEKFALNYADFEDGWNVYATCDGKRIWSSITEEAILKEEQKKGHLEKINKAITDRIKVVKAIIKNKLKVDAEVVLHDVPTKIDGIYKQLLTAARVN